jgi:hypothetical protein
VLALSTEELMKYNGTKILVGAIGASLSVGVADDGNETRQFQLPTQ